MSMCHKTLIHSYLHTLIHTLILIFDTHDTHLYASLMCINSIFQNNILFIEKFLHKIDQNLQNYTLRLLNLKMLKFSMNSSILCQYEEATLSIKMPE